LEQFAAQLQGLHARFEGTREQTIKDVLYGFLHGAFGHIHRLVAVFGRGGALEMYWICVGLRSGEEGGALGQDLAGG